jgi:hypothetical protein
MPYPGDNWHALYGRLDDIPLFARAGAIVPMAPRAGWGGVANPETLEIQLFPGADNRFDLYEDDGRASYSLTPFRQEWEPGRLRFEIGPAEGETGFLPAQRTYTLFFRNIAPMPRVVVQRNGEVCAGTVEYDQRAALLSVSYLSLSPAGTLTVTLTAEDGTLLAARDHRPPACRKLLRACRLDAWVKQAIDRQLEEILVDPGLLERYQLAFSENVARALVEIVTGAGVHHGLHPADGRERVLMWNNGGATGIRYKLAAMGPDWRPAVKGGRLPQFAIIRPGDGEWLVPGPDQERDWQFQPDHWQLDVDYLDLLTLQFGRSDRPGWTHRIVG